MSKYSQAFFGKKEYYEIPPFRFPIYKDLVAGEVEGIEEVGRNQAKHTYALLKIAKDISTKQDISVQEALEWLSDVNDNQEVLFDYVDELAEIQTKGQSITEQKMQTISLFMRYRAEFKEKGKWTLTSDWTDDDTRTMPNRLLDEIYQFVEWERNGWPTGEETEETDEGN